VNHESRALEQFASLLALPESERESFLSRECADDAALRAELESLLEADRTATGFLDHSGAFGPGHPERVGPYRLLRELGHGGMGRVFLAERADALYHKQVAIKFLRSDFGDLRERFANERRILASLDHPYIAKLLDAGSDAHGAPYVVMEYVAGESITHWCEARTPGVPARLELFLKVLEAVQSAHACLVVHRDLKPANILVQPDGAPKLLDFGIAKLIDPAERGVTLTGYAPMTPEYASPEQVRGEAIGTPSDIYALGVLLFELLAGERPYAIETLTPAEIERTVCHTEPARPSAVARARGGSRLDRDLDHVVLKALEKDPAKRYASCAQFGDDLRRYLDGQPVMARATPRWERALKFARRHRAGVASGAAVAIALLVGAGVALVQAGHARAQAEVARIERDRAERVTTFLTAMLGAADPFEGGRKVTVAGLLDAAARDVEAELGADPRTAAAVQQTLAQSYRALGLLDPALREAEAALARVRSDAGTVHALALITLGQIRLERGEHALALPLLEQARELFERDPATALERAECENLLAQLHSQQGRYADAERYYASALATVRERLPGDTPRRAEYINNLAVSKGRAGDLAGAEVLHQQAVDILRRTRGPDHPQTARALAALANVREMREDFDGANATYLEAEAAQRAALGTTHPDLAQTLASHTFMLNRAGRQAEAIERGREAVAAAAALTPPHPMAAYAHSMYGESLLNAGQFAAAVVELKEAARQRGELMPPDHPLRLNSDSLYGSALAAGGAREEGIARMRAAYERLRATLGPEHEFSKRAQARLAKYEAVPTPSS